MNIEEAIFSYLHKSTEKSVTADDLARELKLSNDGLIKLFTALDDLTRQGQLFQEKDGSYCLPQKAGLIAGRLSVNTKGYGFVIPTDDDERTKGDIFIPPDNFSGALNNDIVIVEARAASGSRLREGQIQRILEHANLHIVGTFKKKKDFGVVIPDDHKLPMEIFIHKRSFNGAADGLKVVVDVTVWPVNNRRAEGKIIEIIGKEGEPGVDILSIMHQYNLPEDFPAKVKKAARKIPLTISDEEYQRRQKDDRRQLPIVTIDGEDAKDLDDGVHVARLDNGNFLLGVFIADVSHYVRENDTLDIEARKRGTSVYLVDRVLPMLPKRLSNGICSLNAGEDRLSMAIEMEIDSNGAIINYHIFQTIIKVHRRLSYTIVNKILVDDDQEARAAYDDVVPMLQTLAQLRDVLKARRVKRGAIDFNLPELKVKLDDEGKPIALIKRSGSLGESIIEECMLVANETVAQHMFEKHTPFLYRVHEQPDKEKITSLNTFLAAFKLNIAKNSDGDTEPQAVQSVIAQIQGTPLEKVILPLALRSMKQARYCETDFGHFGLAAKYYTHFTSPIRRYPDLIVHRLLAAMLQSPKIPAKRLEVLTRILPEIALSSSLSERTAISAERDTVDIKKIEYMAAFLGQDFHGIISSVTSFGLFVELDNGVEGLIHISNLLDDYYEYVENQYMLLGSHSGKQYRIGDDIEVVLTRADVKEKIIDFALKGQANFVIPAPSAKPAKQPATAAKPASKTAAKSHRHKQRGKDKKTGKNYLPERLSKKKDTKKKHRFGKKK